MNCMMALWQVFQQLSRQSNYSGTQTDSTIFDVLLDINIY